MRASTVLAITGALLFGFTDLCQAQIGASKEELVRRYGSCQPNPAGKPRGPNVYDSVLDVGEDCTFEHDQLAITSMFKAGKAVAFYYRKERTFWDGLLHGKSYPYLELNADEISDILQTAVPGAEWIVVSADAPIQQWRTSDSSAYAYYFASGHHDLYNVLVQTAAVDAMYKKTDKYIRGLRPN